MDTRDLRVFVEVARLGHFGKAAQTMNLSQPSVSRLIRRLEEDVGVELMSRGRGGVALTPAGVEFLDHARATLRTLESGIRQTRRQARRAQHSVVLGVESSLVIHAMRRALRAFRSRVPEGELRLRRVRESHQRDALLEGHCDLVVAPTDTADPRLGSELVHEDQLVALLPEDHPLAAESTVCFETLLSEPTISTIERSSPLGEEIEAKLERMDRLDFFERVIEVEDTLAMVAMVSSGFGVSAVPRSLLLGRFEGVCHRPLDIHIPVRIHAWWRKGPLDGARSELLACLRETSPGVQSG